MEKRRYVQFLYPGSFMSETAEQPAPGAVPFPPGAYGWRHFWRWEGEAPTGQKMHTERFGFTPRTYVGRVVTLAEVEAGYGTPILLENMKGNRWSRVLECRQGVIPLGTDDTVIAEAPAEVS